MNTPKDSGITLAQCLARAGELASVSDSPRLDMELLLAEVLERNRTWLYTWPEKHLTRVQLDTFEAALVRRQNGEPLAHIIGRREFWSLSLRVDNTTLIPRPDTELLVEVTLSRFSNDLSQQPRRLLDLGTGTGAVALALASERPHWRLQGLDVSPQALELAESNRRDLGFDNVRFLCSNWFAALPAQARFHAIVANPPYIDADDPHLLMGDVRFEPRSALVAGEGGMSAISHIARTARGYLEADGWLLLEHGWDQGPAVRQLLAELSYVEINTQRDLNGRERVSYAMVKEAGK